MHSPQSSTDREADLRSRDAATLRFMGAFFAGFGVLVLIGLFWDQPVEGRVVNACASTILLIIGAAFGVRGNRLARPDRRLARDPGPPSAS